MAEDRLLAALRVIVARLERLELDWALTGSASMALQGVPLQPDDVDLQTDREGAYAIERRFAEAVVEPVRFLESPRIRSHLGALLLEGVRVEIMGAVQKRLPDGSWEPPADVRLHRRFIQVAGLRVPVLALAHERDAYRLLGRRARAELLERWLAALPPGSDAPGAP